MTTLTPKQMAVFEEWARSRTHLYGLEAFTLACTHMQEQQAHKDALLKGQELQIARLEESFKKADELREQAVDAAFRECAEIADRSVYDSYPAQRIRAARPGAFTVKKEG